MCSGGMQFMWIHDQNIMLGKGILLLVDVGGHIALQWINDFKMSMPVHGRVKAAVFNYSKMQTQAGIITDNLMGIGSHFTISFRRWSFYILSDLNSKQSIRGRQEIYDFK